MEATVSASSSALKTASVSSQIWHSQMRKEKVRMLRITVRDSEALCVVLKDGLDGRDKLERVGKNVQVRFEVVKAGQVLLYGPDLEFVR